MNHDIVTSAHKIPMVSMPYHIDFSDFLNFQEAIQSLCQLIEQLNKFDQEDTEKPTKQDILSIGNMIEKISERLLSFLQANEVLSQNEKQQLMQSMQSTTHLFPKMLGKKKNFQHLRFMLMTILDKKQEDTFLSPIQSTPVEVFDVLLNTSDEILMNRTVNLYKTKFIDKNSHEFSRLHHIHTFFTQLQNDNVSPFKREFIVEWIFENALINALLNEDLIYTSITIFKDVVKNFGKDSAFIHGFLRALQKDFITLGTTHDALDQASSLVETMFPLFVTLAKENLAYLSKHIIGFVFDIPLPKEDYRLIKWNQWRWIRMLATNVWDASLREPPSWVIASGSLYCAIIFDAAPSIWLQEYAYLLIERVYAETMVGGFIPTVEHYDYVEFLVRCLKQKAPYFASHGDINLCLQKLSRLTQRESSKETIYNLANVNEAKTNESNPISQALGVLLRMTRAS